VGVVAGADHDGGRGVRSHALAGHQIGCDRGGDPAQADFRALELFVEQLNALGKFPHRQTRDCGRAVVFGPDPECCAGLDVLGGLQGTQLRPQLVSGAVAAIVRNAHAQEPHASPEMRRPSLARTSRA